MDKRRAFLWLGLAMLVVGGLFLAYGGPQVGTALGTTFGLAGVGLMGWSWAGARGGSE